LSIEIISFEDTSDSRILRGDKLGMFGEKAWVYLKESLNKLLLQLLGVSPDPTNIATRQVNNNDHQYQRCYEYDRRLYFHRSVS